MENTEIVVHAEVERVVEESGLQKEGAESLRNAYAPHFTAFQKLAQTAQSIKPTEPKKARAMRLELKKVRVAAEHTRKDLKADSLRRGKAIDGIYNVLEYGLKPVEDSMEAIEKAEEIAEQNRQKALVTTRSAELREIGAEPNFYTLGTMPEEQYQQLLGGLKASKAAAEEAERAAAELKAKQEREAAEARAKKEAEDRAERERLAAENARLAKIAAEEQAKREAAEKKAKVERDAAEKKARAEREAAEAIAAQERAKLEKKAQEARAAQEKAQRELAAKEEAERKQKAEAEKAAKKAAAAPDKKKLLELHAHLGVMFLPQMNTQGGIEAMSRIKQKLAELVEVVKEEAGAL